MSEATTNDNATPSRWQDKTLKAAGMSYVVGDVAMVAAGAARGKGVLGTVSGGATWLAGGIAAARYGNPDTQKQLEIQASKLEAYLRKKGVTIPEDARAQSALLAHKTVWGHVEQFMYEHPSELLNGMYLLGASMLLHEGITKDMAKGAGKAAKDIIPKGLNLPAFKNVSSTFWIGAVVSAGALLGLFVKEDPHARERLDDNAGWLEHATAFVKEQPLRASALLYTVNNGFLLHKVWEDFSARNGTFKSQAFKPHYASGLNLAAYLIGNGLLFASSRSQITKQGFAAEDMAKLENAAAAVIAAQSPETQKTLLADISAFMATQKGVTLPPEKIAADLAVRVGELTRDRLQMANAPAKSFAQSEIHRRDMADKAAVLS